MTGTGTKVGSGSKARSTGNGLAGPRIRAAVLGAGPAGLYAAEALVRHGAEVDLIERLFAPEGLVRYGVAPDHQKIKRSVAVFERILRHPHVHFVGGVEVGRHVTVPELTKLYEQVVIAVGSSGARRLGIPGEDLTGSLSATELVGWYSAHPDHTELAPPLDSERVVVVGAGNVALDVARVLLRDRDVLRATDIAPAALRALASSRVREVVVLARRGPEHAAFDDRELRALVELPEMEVAVSVPDGYPLDETSVLGRLPRVRLDELDLAPSPAPVGMGRVVLAFSASPIELVGVAGRVAQVRVSRGERILELTAGLVVRAIGYRGAPLPGVPFDEARGTIPHERGRVLDGVAAVPGLYVAGWIKRGPTGLIGTNRADAVETVQSMIEDSGGRLSEAVLGPEGDEVASRDAFASTGLGQLLEERGVRVVGIDDWHRIDAFEIAEGARVGAVRRKVTSLDEALLVLGGPVATQRGH